MTTTTLGGQQGRLAHSNQVVKIETQQETRRCVTIHLAHSRKH